MTLGFVSDCIRALSRRLPLAAGPGLLCLAVLLLWLSGAPLGAADLSPNLPNPEAPSDTQHVAGPDKPAAEATEGARNSSSTTGETSGAGTAASAPPPRGRQFTGRSESGKPMTLKELEEAMQEHAVFMKWHYLNVKSSSRIVIQLKDDPGAEEQTPLPKSLLDELSTLGGVRLTYDSSDVVGGGFRLVRLPEPMTQAEAEAVCARLSAHPRVLSAEPSRTAFGMQTTNDPQYPQQWSSAKAPASVENPKITPAEVPAVLADTARPFAQCTGRRAGAVLVGELRCRGRGDGLYTATSRAGSMSEASHSCRRRFPPFDGNKETETT